jgi:selenide,water dikinase
VGAAQLAHVLRELPVIENPDLLVGLDTRDDAGVFRVTDSFALVQTVDFFTPIVDDPYLYGAIAAANSLSDVYAMGGRPLTALNIVCYPPDKVPAEMLAQILRGGYDKVQESGAVMIGGHTVEAPEPLYGLSVTGVVEPDRILANSNAQPGDLIVLTKPIGTGIITTAAKFDDCMPEMLEAACRSMATLNAGAAEAAQAIGSRAATDITGFSLLGHLHNMARASGVQLEIYAEAVPLLPDVERLAARGHITRGGKRNLEHLEPFLQVSSNVSELRLQVLTDPQTSGGLAICVPEAKVEALLEILCERQTPCAVVIGRMCRGRAGVIDLQA